MHTFEIHWEKYGHYLKKIQHNISFQISLLLVNISIIVWNFLIRQTKEFYKPKTIRYLWLMFTDPFEMFHLVKGSQIDQSLGSLKVYQIHISIANVLLNKTGNRPYRLKNRPWTSDKHWTRQTLDRHMTNIKK